MPKHETPPDTPHPTLSAAATRRIQTAALGLWLPIAQALAFVIRFPQAELAPLFFASLLVYAACGYGAFLILRDRGHPRFRAYAHEIFAVALALAAFTGGFGFILFYAVGCFGAALFLRVRETARFRGLTLVVFLLFGVGTTLGTLIGGIIHPIASLLFGIVPMLAAWGIVLLITKFAAKRKAS